MGYDALVQTLYSAASSCLDSCTPQLIQPLVGNPTWRGSALQGAHFSSSHGCLPGCMLFYEPAVQAEYRETFCMFLQQLITHYKRMYCIHATHESKSKTKAVNCFHSISRIHRISWQWDHDLQCPLHTYTPLPLSPF